MRIRTYCKIGNGSACCKRVVFLDKDTKEPQLLALSIEDAGRYLGISTTIVQQLCHNRLNLVSTKLYNKLPYDVRFAKEWEEQNYCLLPKGGALL